MLTEDVIHDILLRLPVRAVCRFRAVSKSCRAAASKPAFLRAYSSRAAAAAHVILSWSATERADATDFQLSASSSGGDPTDRDDERLWDVHVTLPGHCTSALKTSWDGILCVELDTSVRAVMPPPPFHERVPCVYALFNPLSGARAVVPAPVADQPRRCPIGRGFIAGGYSHPVTGAFHLLHCTMSHVAGAAKCTLHFQVLRVDGACPSSPSSWREIPVPVDIDTSTNMWLSVGRGRCVSSATVNGRLHWWPMLDGKLLVFDTEKEVFGSMRLPEVGDTYGAVLREQAITTLSGKLCLLAGFASGMVEVWVLEDYHRGRWQLRQMCESASPATPLNSGSLSHYLGNVGLVTAEGSGRVEKMVFYDWTKMVYDVRHGTKCELVTRFGCYEGLAIHKDSLMTQDMVFGAAPRA